MLRLFPLCLLLACAQQPAAENASAATHETVGAIDTPAARAPVLETFEAGSKGSYATADEALTTGAWRFTDALIGSSPQDHKTGERAARLRGTGRLSMRFDAPAGVHSIRLSAAAYGTDGPSTWELWASLDQGRTFVQAGQAVSTSGPTLRALAFPSPSTTAPLRLELRKTSGGDSRLNFDDLALVYTTTDFARALPPGRGLPPRPLVLSEELSQGPPPRPTPSPAPGYDSNPSSGTSTASTAADHLLLGNPSGATANPANPTNYLLTRPQYAIGYNAPRGTPTWTSWHLVRADFSGTAPRQNDFRADPGLPRQFYAVTPASYGGSGFDRGHNCPSGDRTTTLDDNSATFLMTNMVPQAPQNNQQTWNRLESYTRAQVQQGQEAYVIMGCYGRGGTGSKGPATLLDQGRVTVPARIWKVIVLLPEGDNDLQRLAAGRGRVIAIDTPNDNSLDDDWQKYVTTIDRIEQATGLDLLSALPAAAQARLQRQNSR